MNGHGRKLAVGFTGTKQGMSEFQKRSLYEMLVKFKQDGILYLHHGDCVGADAEAHDLAKEVGLLVAVHPPRNDKKRAFKGRRPRLPA